MVWEVLERGAGKIRAGAKNSVLLAALAGKPTPPREIGSARIAFHRAVLQTAESSRLLCACSRLREALLLVELQCYGLFFLLFGGVSFVVPLLAGRAAAVARVAASSIRPRWPSAVPTR